MKSPSKKNSSNKAGNQSGAPVALVIAASGGVGEATARLLCAEGYQVIGTCRTAQQAKQLLSRGVCHQVVLMDLLRPASMDGAFAEFDKLGIQALDTLAYCAGAMHAGPLEWEPLARMRRLYEVNVFAAVRVVQLALPKLQLSRGRIVLVGSASGGIGLPLFGAYGSSKYALEGIADSLRREVKAMGIDVSLVIPGGIKTAMTRRQVEEADAEREGLNDEQLLNYGKVFERHQTLLSLIESTARTPEQVAAYVIKAIQDPSPQARYFAGIDQAALRAAVRLMPDSMLDQTIPTLLDIANGEITFNEKDMPLPWKEDDMNQLSSFDAFMLFAETSRTPMHVCPFFIYDMSTAPNGVVRFKDIIRTFERRLDAAPILRRKLVRVPLDLDEPYWADDPEFDIERHIRHVALPKPGDRRQLQILLARLTANPMDLSQPPWDAYVIEGLDNVSDIPTGSFGLLLRIHHAAIDGQSGHAVLQALHDLSPVPKKPQRSKSRYVPVPIPSTAQMLSRAYMHILGKPGKMASMIAKTIPNLRRAQSVKRENPGEERVAPHTRFSAKVTSHRVVILLNLDMESLRPVRKAVEGATLNDVIVSIVSGGMRRYLDSKGELPEQNMTTAMPINNRSEAEKNLPGNVLTMAMLNMHSTIVDPLERVKAIHASAGFSKAYSNAIGARIMSQVAESIPAGISALGIRVAGAAGLMDNLPVNTIVTNVPGPQVPLYMAGAKVVEFHAVGILIDGLGLFHSVNSYCGRAAITVLSDRHMLPDPAFYEQCLIESYEEHLAAAAPPPSKSATQASKPVAKKFVAKKNAVKPKSAAKVATKVSRKKKPA